jgi:hypothetical protein
MIDSLASCASIGGDRGAYRLKVRGICVVFTTRRKENEIGKRLPDDAERGDLGRVNRRFWTHEKTFRFNGIIG